MDLKELLKDADREFNEIKQKIPIFERRIRRGEYESVESEVSNLINELEKKWNRLDALKEKVRPLERKYIANAKRKIIRAIKELRAVLDVAKPKAKTLEERLSEIIAKKREIEKENTYAKLKAVAKATLRGLGHDPATVEKAIEMLHPVISALTTAIVEGTVEQDDAINELIEKIENVYGRVEIVPEELVGKLLMLTNTLEKTMADIFGYDIMVAIKAELEERIEETAKGLIKAKKGITKKIVEEVREKYKTIQDIRNAILRDKVTTGYICPTCNIEAGLRGEPEPNNVLLTSPEAKGYLYCPICGGLFKISPSTGQPVLVHRFHD